MELKEKTEIEDPLVSIIVITYNSAKYVLETLESAKAQSYQNIELIVSDDCSTDDTVEICRDWIKENEERFVRTELITAEMNTGIGNNCNRALHRTNGTWIKLIAGDDVLKNNCIKDNIDFLSKNHECNFIFSRYLSFDSETKENINIIPQNNFYLPDSLDSQIESLLIKNYISTPTVFINKTVLNAIDGFSSEYKYLEDYPTFLKLLLNGVKAYYIPRITVLYRISGTSLSNYKGQTTFLNKKWIESYKLFFQNDLSRELKKKQMYIILFLKKSDLILSIILSRKQNSSLIMLIKILEKIIHRSLIFSQNKLHKK